MNVNERKLAASMLSLASDEFSNHCCNDVDDKLWDGWSKQDRIQFAREFHEWNGDPEEFDPERAYLPDFAIMDFLAHKLENESA